MGAIGALATRPDDTRVVECLKAVLKDPNPWVRMTANQALRNLGHPPPNGEPRAPKPLTRPQYAFSRAAPG